MTTKTQKSEETRALILSTALALFREQGFEKTTMREIATEAGVALGATYYYFASKDALVLTFYAQSQAELEPLLAEVLARKHKNLQARLHALITTKLEYFRPNRSLLSALAAHTNPGHSLSPFSEDSRAIRERDIHSFQQALDADKVKYPTDLAPHLPAVLWIYQMGIILYWVYDQSPSQRRTLKLLDKSLPIVTRLIQISTLPLMKPLRKLTVELLETIYGPD